MLAGLVYVLFFALPFSDTYVADTECSIVDTGFYGARYIFHVLSDFGDADLAFRMITRKDYPSYGDIGVDPKWAKWAQDVIEANSAI